MHGRRALLKLIGAVPLGGTGAVKALQATLASPALMTAAALASSALPVEAPPPGSGLVGPIWSAVKMELGNAEDEKYYRSQYREKGIEPDLAVLRSVSPTYKAMRQLERDRAESLMMRKANKLLWGN